MFHIKQFHPQMPWHITSKVIIKNNIIIINKMNCAVSDKYSSTVR